MSSFLFPVIVCCVHYFQTVAVSTALPVKRTIGFTLVFFLLVVFFFSYENLFNRMWILMTKAAGGICSRITG